VQKQRILIVEDDTKTAKTLGLYLENAGFETEIIGDGTSGLRAARNGRHDLMILDLMLPGLSGESVCRTLRAESMMPIVMLTARSTTSDRIEGLELGADDYITKPFSPREVVARVRTVLRRSQPPTTNNGRLAAGGLELDLDRRTVRVDGRQVELTRIENAILAALMRARGRVLSREALIEQAFGHDYDALDRTIDAHIMKLRKKIEPDRGNPIHVLTVFGSGYRIATGNDACG
jgi:DNA-binding response OmpR family regulator